MESTRVPLACYTGPRGGVLRHLIRVEVVRKLVERRALVAKPALHRNADRRTARGSCHAMQPLRPARAYARERKAHVSVCACVFVCMRVPMCQAVCAHASMCVRVHVVRAHTHMCARGRIGVLVWLRVHVRSRVCVFEFVCV